MMPILKIGEAEVHVATTQEMADLLRSLGLAGQHKRAANKKSEDEKPPSRQHEPRAWTLEAYREVARELPDTAKRALSVLRHHERISAKDLATRTGVKAKGVGSILTTIESTATKLGLPSPFTRDKVIEGGDRRTYVDVKADFRAAGDAAAGGG